MADDFALVRIVRVKNYNSVTKLAEIDVKQLKTDYNGDVSVLNAATGTDVTIALAKKLTNAGGWKYSFDTDPICIDPPGATSPCKEGDDLPQGFVINIPTADSFVLSVPQLATGMVSYKYRLFMTRTKAGAAEDVTIDPKITNGGVGVSSSQTPLPWQSPANLSAETLLLLGFLVLVVGVLLGRAWAGREGPTPRAPT